MAARRFRTLGFGALAALTLGFVPALLGPAAPAAAANDIMLSTTGRLNAIVVSKSASHPVAFGLDSPWQSQVCANCAKGNQKSVGNANAGSHPVFYVSDPANGAHCLSTDPAHAIVDHPSALEYVIRWDASCPGPGAGHFTDLVTRVLVEPQVSSDPYLATSTQPATEVEPDTFAFGNTIVSAFQVGRYFNGGAANVGWATSTNGGATWQNGFLPSTTVYASPQGPWQRLSDPSVGYDARHGQWLISSLTVAQDGGSAPNILVSRSPDGLSWGPPVTVVPGTHNYDKEWIACDNTAASPFYGSCYLAWDEPSNSGRVLISHSTDGGLNWSAPITTSDQATGIGTQLAIRPNGMAVLVFNHNSTIVFSTSSNGGASFGSTSSVSPVCNFDPAGGLRADLVLPSLTIDGGGKLFVVWHDCSFRSVGNDIVVATSTNGTAWTFKQRIPIDSANNPIDHFIPGIDADLSTSGTTAHLALTYHFYPDANCTSSTCRLTVGFTTSSDGGATWTSKEVISPAAMQLGWLADTNQGRMVGDYVSTSFVAGKAVTVFSWAMAADANFHQSMIAASRAVPSVG